jgi:hypothetical protein
VGRELAVEMASIWEWRRGLMMGLEERLLRFVAGVLRCLAGVGTALVACASNRMLSTGQRRPCVCVCVCVCVRERE